MASALREALRDPDPSVVRLAAKTLGEWGDRTSIGDLIETLGSGDWMVRQWSAFSLGRLPHRSAVPRLAVALGDKSPAVQRAAAWALGRIEAPESVDALRAASPRRLRTRLAVKRALRRLDSLQVGKGMRGVE